MGLVFHKSQTRFHLFCNYDKIQVNLIYYLFLDYCNLWFVSDIIYYTLIMLILHHCFVKCKLSLMYLCNFHKSYVFIMLIIYLCIICMIYKITNFEFQFKLYQVSQKIVIQWQCMNFQCSECKFHYKNFQCINFQ